MIEFVRRETDSENLACCPQAPELAALVSDQALLAALSLAGGSAEQEPTEHPESIF